jgi:hypothetical protein
MASYLLYVRPTAQYWAEDLTFYLHGKCGVGF